MLKSNDILIDTHPHIAFLTSSTGEFITINLAFCRKFDSSNLQDEVSNEVLNIIRTNPLGISNHILALGGEEMSVSVKALFNKERKLNGYLVEIKEKESIADVTLDQWRNFYRQLITDPQYQQLAHQLLTNVRNQC